MNNPLKDIHSVINLRKSRTDDTETFKTRNAYNFTTVIHELFSSRNRTFRSYFLRIFTVFLTKGWADKYNDNSFLNFFNN